jgi:glycosyltransferase involved in cell wall biosynthesis
MSNSPLFSIVINNYNYAHFLPAAINSVLEQTYQNFELLVVDDASTDHSVQLIKQYSDKLHPILLSENSGQGATFNAALPHCKGEVVCFLDADDIFLPDKLTELAIACQRFPRATMYHHQAQYIDRAGVIAEKIFPENMWQGQLHKKVLQTSEFISAPTSSLAFSKTFLETISPLPAYLTRIGTDHSLRLLAACMGEIAAIPKVLSYYRLHGHNWFSHDGYLNQEPATIRDTLNRQQRGFYATNQILKRLNLPPLNINHNRIYQYMRFCLNETDLSEIIKQTLFNKAFGNIRDRYFYILCAKRLRKNLQSQPDLL